MIDKIGVCDFSPSKLKLRVTFLLIILCLYLLLDSCFCLNKQGLALLKSRARLGGVDQFNAENSEGYSAGIDANPFYSWFGIHHSGGAAAVSVNTEQQHLNLVQRKLLLADLPVERQKSRNGLASGLPSLVSSHAPPVSAQSPSAVSHGKRNNPGSSMAPPQLAPYLSPFPSQSESPIEPPLSSRKLRPFHSPSPSPLLSPSPSPSPSSSRFLPPAPLPTSIDHQPSSSAAASESPQAVSVSNAPPPASSSISAPETSSSAVSNSSSHNKVWIWASVVGGSVFVIVIAVSVYICRTSKVATVKPWATGLSGQLQKAFISGVPKLKRAELETACEDFSNIIGTLTDSIVYKGTLSDGAEIAVVSSLVKSHKQWSKFLETEFRRKVETLSLVNHRNFVNLIGYCEELKPFTRMMIFEYAPNGTLFEHLHIKEAERLDWRTRLRIISGMAYCLQHMHQLNPPIPHRNLQSSSIYLTEDYAAKVSDFSFCTESLTSTNSSYQIRSPSMQLLDADSTTDTTESNVHSFGIILLEVITGRIPYSAGSVVEDWVWNYLTLAYLPKEKIDPTLILFDSEEVQPLFCIVKDCVNPDPKARPGMRDVTSRLKEITGIEPDGAAPRLSPLWWAELEISEQ